MCRTDFSAATSVSDTFAGKPHPAEAWLLPPWPHHSTLHTGCRALCDGLISALCSLHSLIAVLPFRTSGRCLMCFKRDVLVFIPFVSRPLFGLTCCLSICNITKFLWFFSSCRQLQMLFGTSLTPLDNCFYSPQERCLCHFSAQEHAQLLRMAKCDRGEFRWWKCKKGGTFGHKKAEHSCGRCCYRPSVLGTGMSQREGERGLRGNSSTAPAGTVMWWQEEVKGVRDKWRAVAEGSRGGNTDMVPTISRCSMQRRRAQFSSLFWVHSLLFFPFISFSFPCFQHYFLSFSFPSF